MTEAIESSLTTLSRRLTDAGIDHALIGGVAVSLHGPPRATRDLDFLVDGAVAARVQDLMEQLGFETLQRTAIFANYLLGTLRVDFLHTQGPLMRSMLERAIAFGIGELRIKAARPEDLIGLKLQALANAPERFRDEIDIRALLHGFHTSMDMALVRDYFVLFDKEHEFETILAAIAGRRG